VHFFKNFIKPRLLWLSVAERIVDCTSKRLDFFFAGLTGGVEVALIPKVRFSAPVTEFIPIPCLLGLWGWCDASPIPRVRLLTSIVERMIFPMPSSGRTLFFGLSGGVERILRYLPCLCEAMAGGDLSTSLWDAWEIDDLSSDPRSPMCAANVFCFGVGEGGTDMFSDVASFSPLQNDDGGDGVVEGFKQSDSLTYSRSGELSREGVESKGSTKFVLAKHVN
jgi:hypothetical protein